MCFDRDGRNPEVFYFNQGPSKLAKQKLKTAAHIMGLNSAPFADRAIIANLGPFMEKGADGSEEQIAYPILINMLDDFYPDDDLFSEINACFKLSQQVFGQHPLNLSKLFEHYQKFRTVIIPCGWEGHRLTLGLRQDVLMIANRGSPNHLEGGVTIYALSSASRKKLRDEAYFYIWIQSFLNLRHALEFRQKVSESIKKTRLNQFNYLDLTSGVFSKEQALALIHPLRPVVVQKWGQGTLHIVSSLAATQRFQSSFVLCPQGLYQYDESGQSQFIPMRNFDQFVIALSRKINIVIDFAFQHSFDLPLSEFKRLVDEYSGHLQEPLPRISYYYLQDVEIRNQSIYLPAIELDQDQPLRRHLPAKLSFPSKPQKQDHCSFGNKKSLIEAMIFLALIDQGQTVEVALLKARQQYKHLTHHMRLKYVDGILADFLSHLEDENQKKLNLYLLRRILEKPHKPSSLEYQLMIVNTLFQLAKKNACLREEQRIIDSFFNTEDELKSFCKILIDDGVFEPQQVRAFIVGEMSHFKLLYAQFKQFNFGLCSDDLNALLENSSMREACAKIFEFQVQQKAKHRSQTYQRIVDRFCRDSLRDILTWPDTSPQSIHARLMANAKQAFPYHQDWLRRLLLDALAMIASLGLILIYHHCKHQILFFNSQAKVEEQALIEKNFSHLSANA